MVPSALGEIHVDARKESTELRLGGGRKLLAHEIARGRNGQLVLAGQVAGAGTGVPGQVELDLETREAGHGDRDGIADEGCAARDDRAGVAAERSACAMSRRFPCRHRRCDRRVPRRW